MFQSAIQVLRPHDLDLIHASALEILRDVGTRVDHPRMRSLLSDFGCPVQNDIVKFPEALVEQVVDKMRDPGFQTQGYTGTLPINLERVPKTSRIVPVATGQATVAHDLDTDTLRPATRADLAASCRVADNLPGVITGHPVFLPQEFPAMVRDLFALITVAESYPYSDFVEIYSPEVVPYFLEAGEVICGSREALKKAPPFCSWAFATPPLIYGQHGFEIVFQLKDFGLECGYGVGGVMPILGASTPFTLAGYLAMLTAEALACNVMNWTLLGRVSGYGGGPALLDVQELASSQGNPEAVLLFLACMELQRYYGAPEPMFPYALGTDAKLPDVQAGIDKSFKATVAVLAGSRLLSAGLGCLAVSGVASLAQMVIDYELCKNLERLVSGFPVNADEIEMELIKQVGIGGSFLAEPKSVRHMRETLHMSRLFDRGPAGGWTAEKGMMARAKERVRTILNKDKAPCYLSGEQRAELERIGSAASAALG